MREKDELLVLCLFLFSVHLHHTGSFGLEGSQRMDRLLGCNKKKKSLCCVLLHSVLHCSVWGCPVLQLLCHFLLLSSYSFHPLVASLIQLVPHRLTLVSAWQCPVNKVPPSQKHPGWSWIKQFYHSHLTLFFYPPRSCPFLHSAPGSPILDCTRPLSIPFTGLSYTFL